MAKYLSITVNSSEYHDDVVRYVDEINRRTVQFSGLNTLNEDLDHPESHVTITFLDNHFQYMTVMSAFESVVDACISLYGDLPGYLLVEAGVSDRLHKQLSAMQTLRP